MAVSKREMLKGELLTKMFVFGRHSYKNGYHSILTAYRIAENVTNARCLVFGSNKV